MEQIGTFLRRLKRLGIEVELFSNIPWIYIDRINGKKITEKFWSDHYFTLALRSIKEGDKVNFINLKETFKIIRKYGKG